MIREIAGISIFALILLLLLALCVAEAGKRGILIMIFALLGAAVLVGLVYLALYLIFY